MSTQAEEDLLVLAAQDGNHQAFTALILRYQSKLIRFSYQLCSDLEIAKDVTQDVWIHSAKKLYKLNDPRAFKSWIYKLVRWRTMDALRKSNRTDLVIELVEDIADVEMPKEQIFEQDIDSEQSLHQGIQSLPRVEKQIIQLFYLDEMSVAEVSLILDIPKGTVKSRLNRARQLLKQKCEGN